MIPHPWRPGNRVGKPVPAAGSGLADAFRAVPLTALVVLIFDIVTTIIWQALGVPDLGDTGLIITLHRGLLIAAAAATMWHRPRAAVLTSAVVVLLVFTVGPTGEELWLLIIVGVTAAIRANRWQLALVLLPLAGYVVGFGFLVEQTYPGEGSAARTALLAITGAALVVGLVARWLLRARDRRRSRVRQLEREQAEIRAVERARLADDLQLVVTQGLAGITDELDRASSRPSDLAGLRSGLDQIGRRSGELLEQLRVLLEVLRRCPDAEPVGHPAPPTVPGPRRVVELLTARHVRIAATAVLALLAGRAAVGDLGTPAAEVWIQVGGLLAYALAVWRPEVGVSCAVLVVAASIGLGPTSSWDLLSTTLVCLVAAVRWRPRTFWIAMLGVAGYAGFLADTEADPVDHVLLLCLLAFAPVAGGLAARHLVTARRQSLRALAELTDERGRIEVDERGSVARELHDVVAHSLSVIAMLVLATSLSSDRRRLVDTLDQVRRSVDTARQELSTLVHGLRGPDSDGSPVAPLVSPRAPPGAGSRSPRRRPRSHHPAHAEPDPHRSDDQHLALRTGRVDVFDRLAGRRQQRHPPRRQSVGRPRAWAACSHRHGSAPGRAARRRHRGQGLAADHRVRPAAAVRQRFGDQERRRAGSPHSRVRHPARLARGSRCGGVRVLTRSSGRLLRGRRARRAGRLTGAPGRWGR